MTTLLDVEPWEDPFPVPPPRPLNLSYDDVVGLRCRLDRDPATGETLLVITSRPDATKPFAITVAGRNIDRIREGVVRCRERVTYSGKGFWEVRDAAAAWLALNRGHVL